MKLRLLPIFILALVLQGCSTKTPAFPPGRIGKLLRDYDVLVFRPSKTQNVVPGQRLDIYRKGEFEGYVRTAKYHLEGNYWIADIFSRSYNHFEEGDELRTRDGEKDAPDPYVLWGAFAAKDLSTFKQILERYSDKDLGMEDPDSCKNGETVLFKAIRLKRLDIVKYMLGRGMDINHVSKPQCHDTGRETPLHIASMVGDLDAVKLLVLKGARVNARCNRGTTPLHRVALLSEVDMARLLISSGAEINTRCIVGQTPLDWADSREIREFLIKHGASAGKELEKGTSPDGK